jgi:glycosyltransferase involved in cell wall biosynthesis
VHEAALSGCGLLLSNKVGAADDLLTLENGFTFNPNDINQMTSVFIQAMKMDCAALMNAQNVSLRLAKEINLDSFVKNVISLVRDRN